LPTQVVDSAEQPVDMKKREITAPARFPKRGPLDGQRVLLVDDVLTTGATCHFAAEALIAAGARDVFVAVLARGQGDEDSGMTPSAVP
jgi:predicted amidophosphoribosyltransferase